MAYDFRIYPENFIQCLNHTSKLLKFQQYTEIKLKGEMIYQILQSRYRTRRSVCGNFFHDTLRTTQYQVPLYLHFIDWKEITEPRFNNFMGIILNELVYRF